MASYTLTYHMASYTLTHCMASYTLTHYMTSFTLTHMASCTSTHYMTSCARRQYRKTDCENLKFHIQYFSVSFCNPLLYRQWEGERRNSLFYITDNACTAKSISDSLSTFADCGTALVADCYEVTRYEKQNVTPQSITFHMASQFGKLWLLCPSSLLFSGLWPNKYQHFKGTYCIHLEIRYLSPWLVSIHYSSCYTL
jgi:hypothetical protein